MEILLSRPLSLIFIILPHCLNTTDVNNYSISAIGKWSCEDKVLKESPRRPPLNDFERSPNGSNPRIVGENAPKTPYRSLYALVLATLRFKKMSRETAQGRDNFSAIDFLESELVGKRLAGGKSLNVLR